MWIAESNHVKEIDRRASEEFGVPAMVLMERAGISVFDAVKEMLPEGGRIVVVCGKGNNGGDGLVAARHAFESQNFYVEVLIAAQEEELSADAKTQLSITRASGLHPLLANDARYQRRLECLGSFDLVIDALLGIGADGHVHGHIQDAIRAINFSGVPVVSVDVPSGIHADTGADLGESIWALRTVTFGLPKPCFFQGIGLEHAGYWSVADIGYPSSLLEDHTSARLIERFWAADLMPERMRNAHKRDNGHVLIIAGSREMPGAAVLCAMGALRSGAGLVTLCSVESTTAVAASVVPEAIHVSLPEQDGYISQSAEQQLRDLASRADSVVVGPGLGVHDSTRNLLDRLFRGWDHPTTIDADALNAISHGVSLPLAEVVMTPHPGEMSRLLKCSVAEVQADRFASIRSAIQRFAKTVMLKGPHTIIGDPYQPLAVNSTGNSGMASAGVGDVLSGVIGTLLSQDLPPYCAAAVAAYWHGLAGDLCAEKIGNVGFLASDIAHSLPQARAKLMASCDSRSRVRSSPSSCSI